MPSRTITPFETLDYLREFRIWAKTHGVTPIILHRKTGWSYQYCYSLVRGKKNEKFGYHSFGMILCAFGLEAMQYIINLAPEKLRALQK